MCEWVWKTSAAWEDGGFRQVKFKGTEGPGGKKEARSTAASPRH